MTIKSISFNQDYSCLSIGTETGYKVFNCDPFGECFEKSDDGGASITEMLFSTSLIGIVGLGDSANTSRRKLKIINTKRKVIICELTFPGPILSIKLNRKRLIVVLIDQIFVYDVSCMKLLHTIETSNSNTLGIAELSSNQESILAFPSPDNSSSIPFANSNNNINSNGNSKLTNNKQINGGGGDHHHQIKLSSSSQQGSVIIFDTISLQPMNIIQCHKSPLQRITISKDGTLLATASVKGTIVRVFRIKDGKKLYEFRRGSYNALITCLSFSLNNCILGCCSNTGTVHLFKLNESPKLQNARNVSQSLEDTGDALGNSTTCEDYNYTDNNNNITNDNNNKDNDTTSNTTALDFSGADEGNRRSSNTGLQQGQGELLPTETTLTEEENEELNNILKTNINDKFNSFGSNHHNVSRKKSISDYLWNSAFAVSSKVKGQVNNYLPNTVTSMIEPKRHFAFIKLPNSLPDIQDTQDSITGVTTSVGSNNNNNNNNNNNDTTPHNGAAQIDSIVSINSLNSTVSVGTKDGNFFIYSLPSMEKGGECILLKQYKLH